jgi:DNA-binding GntR family transcriptional regulator
MHRYERVIELVERLIAESGSSPGTRLPSRQELARMSGVSMITVRRALDELERAGRVTSHQGVGTFVSRPRIVTEPGRTGPLLDTLQGNQAPPPLTTRVLELREGLPGASIANALNLSPGAQVWLVRRLREFGGVPAIVEQAVIPVALAPDLEHYRAELGTSLYGLLSRVYGLDDDSEEQYLEVALATAEERRRLALARSARVVRLRGITADAAGVPFDCFEQVYPADDFVFYAAGHTARRVLKVPDVRDWQVVPIEGAAPDRAVGSEAAAAAAAAVAATAAPPGPPSAGPSRASGSPAERPGTVSHVVR